MRVENMINSRLPFLKKFIMIKYFRDNKIRLLYDVFIESLSFDENLVILNKLYREDAKIKN